ncbi:MAG: hypothetical protein HW416_1878 [Chloroflexi bacterium]|nr:hypothetical protein [Chloroflexota bacterium]
MGWIGEQIGTGGLGGGGRADGGVRRVACHVRSCEERTLACRVLQRNPGRECAPDIDDEDEQQEQNGRNERQFHQRLGSARVAHSLAHSLAREVELNSNTAEAHSFVVTDRNP